MQAIMLSMFNRACALRLTMLRHYAKSFNVEFRTLAARRQPLLVNCCTFNNQQFGMYAAKRNTYTIKMIMKRNTSKYGESKKIKKIGLRDKLLKKFETENDEQTTKLNNKITVVGCGQVGIACICFILAYRLTTELCIMDLRKDWIAAEADDFLHGSATLGDAKIITCSDGSKTKNSRIIVITAGARPKKGETRLDVAQKTADILKTLVPGLIKNSPNAIFIIISNPADVMTYIVQKIGKLPRHRCFTTGCHLDSLRFRYFIAKRLGIASKSVSGYIIGEHGNSSVPLWSSVAVGGVPLMRINPEIGTECDEEDWNELHTKVVDAALDLIKIKNYTNWGIGISLADVIQAMQENSGRILSIGTNVNGFNGFKDDVVLSLPCVLNADGIGKIIELKMTDDEKRKLKKSAKVLLKAQAGIKI